MSKRTPIIFTEPFTVSDRIRELAREKGWPNPDSEVDEFVDYYSATGWKMKGGQPIVDRDAAFRLWLRNRARWRAESQVENEPPARTGVWAKRLI
jgi:hypothetical protein